MIFPITISLLFVQITDKYTEAETIAFVESLGGSFKHEKTPIGNHVTEISLRGSQLTDAEIKKLLELRFVRTLDLARTNVTAVGLKELESMQSLRALDLSGMTLTGEEFKAIRKIRNLQTLRMRRTKLSPLSIRELSSIRQLRTLVMTDVTDKSVLELDLPNLRTLVLGGKELTDVGLTRLGRIKDLQQLYLEHCEVTDIGMKELAGMSQLKNIHLYDMAVTDEGLKQIVKLPGLLILTLNRTKVTDDGVGKLRKELKNCIIEKY
jgi:Leucine-rich repeat (LRR) protein